MSAFITENAGELLKEINGGRLRAIYLLQGEEGYFIDQVAEAIDACVMPEGEKSFNQTVVYGKDVEGDQVKWEARQFPMMAERRHVEVREAQNLRQIDALADYAAKPSRTTVLVLCHKNKTIDKRSKLYKAIASSDSAILTANPIYENKVPGWVADYLKERKIKIEPNAAQLVADSLGNNLSKIVSELEKLQINLPNGGNVSVADIETNIGFSKDYNLFELNNAVSRKDWAKCLKIARYFVSNPKSGNLIGAISTLTGHFTKLALYHSLPSKDQGHVAKALGVHPFLVKEYEAAAKSLPMSKVVGGLGILLEFDLRAKGIEPSSATEGGMLEEMLFKLCQ